MTKRSTTARARLGVGLAFVAAMYTYAQMPLANAEILAWGDDSWRYQIPDTAEGFRFNWRRQGASYVPAYAAREKVRVRLDACDTQIRGQTPTNFWWAVADESAVAPSAEEIAMTAPGTILTRLRSDNDLDTSIRPPIEEDPAPPPAPCVKHVDLPPGRYTVTVGIGMTSIAPDRTRSRQIQVSKLRIAVVGDSMAAGEGNPDVPAEFLECFLSLTCLLDDFGDMLEFRFDGLPEAYWVDRRCHRSRGSAFTLVPSALDYYDDRTAVTTLSFACSGATINALTDGYDGQEFKAGDLPVRLPGQIDALAAALPPRPLVSPADLPLCGTSCTTDSTDKRPHVDALVISVGINDLDFSTLVKTCAESTPAVSVPSIVVNTLVGDCNPPAHEVVRALLQEKFDSLAKKIKERLYVGRVFITEYPYLALTDSAGNAGGCNFLFGITSTEAMKMHAYGESLNRNIAEAARKHGWHYVGGIVDAFKGHGYCAQDSWYVQFWEAISNQVKYDGTLHPNHKGHAAIAAQIRKAFEQERLMIRRGTWRLSSGGVEPWYELNYAMESEDLVYGDFDGDGRQDVLLADGTSWRVSLGARERFTRINSLADKAELLRVGDFDGDGKDDLFRVAGSNWYISYGATSPWTKVNVQSVALSNLRFGKFGGPGDRTTDVMYADGFTWQVSDGGKSPWRQFAISALRPSDLYFADVNGDGRTDILRLSGTSVLVRLTGATVWTPLQTLPVHLSKVKFGDFNGNKKADAFWMKDGKWFVSYDMQSVPTLLHGYVLPVTSFALGDFNGDGKSDVFTSERPVN